jgi:hypothetical protein
MYIVISIGNTDNKLTQQEWSSFVVQMDSALHLEGKIHFFGGSSTWDPWQNAAWILESTSNIKSIQEVVTLIRKRYNQESAFFMIGDGTPFV